MAVLQFKNIVKRYGGVQALRGVSFGVEAGTITAVVGPNGSGKTTLVNVLSGLAPFSGGSILVSGAAISRIAPYDLPGYGITRTFQSARLFEQMTVLDNILVVLTDRRVLAALFERHGEYHLRRAEEVLRRAGLWEKRLSLAAGLSYGQRKLLEIARTLAMDARIVLFDEPFAGLFPEMVRSVSGLLREFRGEGKTIVLIEHDMAIIRELADRVVVMDSGEVLAEGKPEEVLSRKAVIEAYLGA